MEIIGLDLHKREHPRCITAGDGTITGRRIVTSRERFTAVFGVRPRARILLEASTESEWVARHLESLGHDVIVADPNDAPRDANRSRRTKTDTRDARTRMDARRHVRPALAVRDALVRTRTRSIALAKAQVRRDGLRAPTGRYSGCDVVRRRRVRRAADPPATDGGPTTCGVTAAPRANRDD